MSRIREAVHLDLLPLSELASAYVQEVADYGGVTYSHEAAVQGAMATISHPDGTILLATSEGRILGFIWAFCGQHLPWSQDLIASDVIHYVLPEHRGKLVGYRLLKAYRDWAVAKGAKVVNLSVASGITTDRTVKLFERLGFQPIANQSRLIV